jgi:hypothetical protein
MQDILDNLQDNPIGSLLGIASLVAILGGLAVGAARGSFKVDPTQATIEARQQSETLRHQSIKIANQRFDDGCEGVFYLQPKSSIYQPLTEGTGVLSGVFWQRWHQTKGTKLQPALTDYLPAGTVVCDSYGNAGILAPSDRGHAVVSDLVNTPDRTRIQKMMERYPTATRPQVGAKAP